MKPPTLYVVVARLLLFLGFLSVNVFGVDTAPFSRQPARNTTVREGDTATLQCAVRDSHEAEVQWTANGFGLGTVMLGGRCQFVGDKSKGEYNLEIRNAQLGDDGRYECQVTNKGIRSRSVNLTVLIPPKKIVLEPAQNGVMAVQHLVSVVTVTCVVPDAKPAAEISWKVNGKTFLNKVDRPPSAGSKAKLITSSSSISLSIETLRNGSAVECIARHKALREPMSKTVILNILHPPNQPVISGIPSDPLIAGEDIDVKCVSDGGNPPADITWTIGDQLCEGAYESSGMKAQSILWYSPKGQDNGKYLKCVVKSTALSAPLAARERLEVYYPPEKVVIDRDPIEGVEVNEDITFVCHHTDSNPAPILEWFLDGAKLPNKTSKSVGAISFHTYTLPSTIEQQRIALTLRRIRLEDSNIDIKCRARIPEIAFDQEVTVHPKVNYPPRKVSVTIENPLNSPVINNIHLRNDSISSNIRANGMTFVAGHTIRLSCEAKGGNPAPDLSWFVTVNGKAEKIETSHEVETVTPAAYSSSLEFSTRSSIELQLESTHNKATITCKASHSRYKNVALSNITLAVAFSPDSLRVEQFPKIAVAGKALSLTCTTTSSFPAATISWYRGSEVVNLEPLTQLPVSNGENSGYISSSRLRLQPKDVDDGTTYTCQAVVKPLRDIVMQQYTVRVEYAPRFRRDQKSVYNTTAETQSLQIKIQFNSNPTSCSFRWFRYEPSTEASPPQKTRLSLQNRRFDWNNISRTLTIKSLKRSDDGIYTIQASNVRGSAERNITVNVFYSPKIVEIVGPPGSVNEGDSVTLRCDFNSHPLTRPRVVWLKDVPGIGRSDYNVTTHADHSLLSITNLTAKDRGGYKCIVDNGVGDGDSRTVTVDLSYAPVIEETPEKVAVSSIGKDSAVTPKLALECVVHSQPPATVQWLFGNKVINSTIHERFAIVESHVDGETIKNTLAVKQLDVPEKNKDAVLLGGFTCKASNTLGVRMKVINVVTRGPPDAPTAMLVDNKTETAVTLSWKENFNGGSNQSFLVQYSTHTKQLFQEKIYETRSKSPRVTVTGLHPDKEYIFRVLAENIRGQSQPSRFIRVRTAPPKETGSTPQIESVQTTQIFIFIAVAVVAFTIIIVTSTVVYRRCRDAKKKTYRPEAIDTDSESLNAESSLSSRCSTAKTRADGKLTKDAEIIELHSMNECKRHLLDNGNEVESIVSDSPYGDGPQSCFERSQSRCSNEIAIFRQGGCNATGGCTFSSFKSPPEPNTSPSKSLLDFRNKRGTYLTPTRPNSNNLPRDSHEAKFRFDVKPTEDCLRTYSDDLRDSYSDIQLPPRLQPYESMRSYGPTSTVDSNNHEDEQLRTLISPTENREYEDVMLPRSCHTIGPTNLNRDFYSGVLSNRCGTNYSDIGLQREVSERTTCDMIPACYYTLASPPSRESMSRYPFASRSDGVFTNSKSAVDLCARSSAVNATDFPPPPLEAIKESHLQEKIMNNNPRCNFKSSFRRNPDGSLKSNQTQSVRFQDNVDQEISNTCAVLVPSPSPHNLEHGSSDDDTDSGCGGSADVQVRRVLPTESNDKSSKFSSSHSTGVKSTELRELRV